MKWAGATMPAWMCQSTRRRRIEKLRSRRIVATMRAKVLPPKHAHLELRGMTAGQNLR